MTDNVLVIEPAYGRSYADVASLMKDWEEGKDFKISFGGPYCSIRNLELIKERGYKALVIRSKQGPTSGSFTKIIVF